MCRDVRGATFIAYAHGPLETAIRRRARDTAPEAIYVVVMRPTVERTSVRRNRSTSAPGRRVIFICTTM